MESSRPTFFSKGETIACFQEIALINLETYYSFPNIDKTNNSCSYSSGANAQWFEIIIPEGSYHVKDINEFIQRDIRKILMSLFNEK